MKIFLNHANRQEVGVCLVPVHIKYVKMQANVWLKLVVQNFCDRMPLQIYNTLTKHCYRNSFLSTNLFNSLTQKALIQLFLNTFTNEFLTAKRGKSFHKLATLNEKKFLATTVSIRGSFNLWRKPIISRNIFVVKREENTLANSIKIIEIFINLY